MDTNREILVLYKNKEDNTYHEVLLNDLEIDKIASEISKIFAAKKSNVMVSNKKLNIGEVELSEKRNSSQV